MSERIHSMYDINLESLEIDFSFNFWFKAFSFHFIFKCWFSCVSENIIPHLQISISLRDKDTQSHDTLISAVTYIFSLLLDQIIDFMLWWENINILMFWQTPLTPTTTTTTTSTTKKERNLIIIVLAWKN